MEIAEALKRFRRELKLNQREVAAALKIPYQSYQGYEYGRNIPSAKIIANLADIYNVSADYLLGRSDNPQGIIVNDSKNTVEYNEEEVKSAFALRDALKAVIRDSFDK